MGTASVRSGSHPVILQTVVSGSVQVTVIVVGLLGWGLPFPFSTRLITAAILADYSGAEPRFESLPINQEPCGF
jgi:hypothetical protein